MSQLTDLNAEVVLALHDYAEGRTLSEIADALRRAPSSVQRALASLTRRGIVTAADGTRRRYRLNPEAPTSALVKVARWSLATDGAAEPRRGTRGLAARRSAARLFARAAPRSEAARWVPGAVERVVDRFNPTRIILFGSQARGDARWDSDFDFLVVLPDVQDARSAAIDVRRALRDLPVAKDVMVVSQQVLRAKKPIPGTALHEALSNGMTVYERPS